MTAHRTTYNVGDRVKIRYRPQQMGTITGRTLSYNDRFLLLVLWDVSDNSPLSHHVPLPMESENLVLVFRPSNHFPTCSESCGECDECDAGITCRDFPDPMSENEAKHHRCEGLNVEYDAQGRPVR